MRKTRANLSHRGKLSRSQQLPLGVHQLLGASVDPFLQLFVEAHDLPMLFFDFLTIQQQPRGHVVEGLGQLLDLAGGFHLGVAAVVTIRDSQH